MRLTAPSRRALWLILAVGLGLAAALFAGCGNPIDPPITPTPTRTPRPSATPTPTPVPPTPTPAWPVTVFVPREGLPAPVAEALSSTLAAHADLFVAAPSADGADVRVVLGPAGELSPLNEAETNSNPGLVPLAEWVYAVVAPFPTLTDGIAWSDMTETWAGNPAGPFAGRPLLMDSDTYAVLTALLGPSAEGMVTILPSDQLLDIAWAERPSWAILPFDRLEPRWKVLRVDGASVLDRELDPITYPLVVNAGMTGLERGVARLEETLGPPVVNRDPAKMTVLMMTGVTALTRATAMRMARQGVTYPAQDIRPWLLEPDVTHISNEVSFAEDCPPPGDYYTMVFCSDPSFIGLLEEIDVDVIELTGNHLLDWGVGAMENSLEMYEQRGIPYFGGGWDLAQAHTPLTLTHGVHTFAFVGCNPAGPRSAWATEGQPGAAPCAYGALHEQIVPQVRQLREQGLIPIVTLQYLETDRYEPTPQQRADFRALAEAGAVIVSGSQAHQPQGFDFQDGIFIHYGLGNLFFDQMQRLEYRQEFLDRHVFYDGRHVSTEVLTAMLEDYARPRPMTGEEREVLLRAAFAASGW